MERLYSFSLLRADWWDRQYVESKELKLKEQVSRPMPQHSPNIKKKRQRSGTSDCARRAGRHGSFKNCRVQNFCRRRAAPNRRWRKWFSGWRNLPNTGEIGLAIDLNCRRNRGQEGEEGEEEGKRQGCCVAPLRFWSCSIVLVLQDFFSLRAKLSDHATAGF